MKKKIGFGSFLVRKSDSCRQSTGNPAEKRAPQQEKEEAEGRRRRVSCRPLQLGHHQEDQGRVPGDARPTKIVASTSARS